MERATLDERGTEVVFCCACDYKYKSNETNKTLEKNCSKYSV